MSDEAKIVAAGIVNFLNQQLEGDTLSADAKESLEVSLQCVRAAYDLSAEQLARGPDLLQLVRQRSGGEAADRAEAERLKNEGNELMKAEKHREALEKYSRAIEIDPRNAVYFCNRAAAQFKLGQNEAAVADCAAALALQPEYGKAHGRLGIALTALERHREARAAFARAAQLEPDNESYKQNLRLAEERLAERPVPLELGGLLQNPQLLNMASEMLSDPNMQNIISGLMGSSTLAGGLGASAGGMDALLQAGQALAQHMQAANPDLVASLRRQTRPPGPDGPPPPSAPPAPPAPPSQ